MRFIPLVLLATLLPTAPLVADASHQPRAQTLAAPWHSGPRVDTLPEVHPVPASMADVQPDLPGNQTHVIYFVPTDKPYQGLESNGTLARVIDGALAWFERETSNQGGAPLRPRMDRRANLSYDISFVQGNGPASAYPSLYEISTELIQRSFNLENKRYLVFAALSANATGNPGGLCGEGYYPTPGFSIRRYAVVYLDANPGCGARDFGGGTARTAGQSEAIAVHEWLHLEGAPPLVARHHCPPPAHYHVCFGPLWLVPPQPDLGMGYIDPESVDVLFPLIWSKLADLTLDRNRDDYLDHGLPTTDVRASIWLEPVQPA